MKKVALFTRAWIEIARYWSNAASAAVALFTRAWIEIIEVFWCFVPKSVALFTRAWIEITLTSDLFSPPFSRPLHEGVD